MMRETAQKIVEAIVLDMTDRSGLDGAWDSIDAETQAEIKACWLDIVVNTTERVAATTGRRRPGDGQAYEYIDKLRLFDHGELNSEGLALHLACLLTRVDPELFSECMADAKKTAHVA